MREKEEVTVGRLYFSDKVINVTDSVTDLKYLLEREHGLVQHPKADLLFEIAWEYGHSAGLSEVEMYYGRLAELFK